MDIDILTIVIFYSALILIYLLFKKRFVTQGITVLYKTKFGLKFMELVPKKFPRATKLAGYIGIGLGFIGMVVSFFFLIWETAKLMFVPGTQPAVAPVLPGITLPGMPTLSFWHWIIAIFITATVHELSHGILARFQNIKIKSSGIFAFGPILGAFVEQDEKEMSKKPAKAQLSMLGAGPFANIIFGLLFFAVLSFVTAPLFVGSLMDQEVIVSAIEGYPMAYTNITSPFKITEVDGLEVSNIIEFKNLTLDLMPGENITLGTDKGTYAVTATKNPENESRGFIGIAFEELGFEFKFLGWLNLLVIWVFIINIGVGLFNYLPIGPADGGRMFYILALRVFKNKEKARRAAILISSLVIALIVINFLPWIEKLFRFLLGA